MFNETYEAWEAILLCLEYFCLGGQLFTKDNKIKKILFILVFVFGSVLLIF